MTFKVERVDTCTASISDQPGSLAYKLIALAEARANLEFVTARRSGEEPGKAVVCVAPIKGRGPSRAAWRAGFAKTTSHHTVRVEGPDRPGQGARITQALANQGLNMRSLTVTTKRNEFVAYIDFDTSADAARATRILRGL